MTENKIQSDDFQHAETILKKAYNTFNLRDIESTLAAMHSDVESAIIGQDNGHLLIRMLNRFNLTKMKTEE